MSNETDLTWEEYKRVKPLIERINTIRWGYIPDNANREKSIIALFCEFIRRTVTCELEIASIRRLLDDKQVKNRVNQLKLGLSLPEWGYSSGLFLKAAMSSIIVSQIYFSADKLVCSGIYEPLLRFHERGGIGFKRDQGFYDVWYGRHLTGVSIFQSSRKPSLLDMTDIALDKLDKNIK